MQPQPWIKLRIKELPGKSLGKLGQAMGNLDAARVTEVMAGTRRVQPREAQAMAAYLELPYETVHQRLFGSVPPIGGDVHAPRAAQWVQQPGSVLGVRDLGGGIMELIQGPPIFTAASEAFSCYVVNDLMAPALRRGDLITVTVIQPAHVEDDVLFISGKPGEPRIAALRHLVAIKDDHYVVKQWNPEKNEKLDFKTWHTALRVEYIHRR